MDLELPGCPSGMVRSSHKSATAETLAQHHKTATAWAGPHRSSGTASFSLRFPHMLQGLFVCNERMRFAVYNAARPDTQTCNW
jgi:hypothetical protein